MYIYIYGYVCVYVLNSCFSHAVSAVLWVVDREDLPVLHVRLPGGDDAAEAAEALGGPRGLLVLALLLLDETWSPEELPKSGRPRRYDATFWLTGPKPGEFHGSFPTQHHNIHPHHPHHQQHQVQHQHHHHHSNSPTAYPLVGLQSVRQRRGNRGFRSRVPDSVRDVRA